MPTDRKSLKTIERYTDELVPSNLPRPSSRLDTLRSDAVVSRNSAVNSHSCNYDVGRPKCQDLTNELLIPQPFQTQRRRPLGR